jgi:hypothetical protein
VEAAALYERACESGVADACAGLSYLVENGKGVAPDAARALALEQRACEAGSAHGCHSLGVSYYRATGVEKDAVRSTRLYERACAGGWKSACRDLGNALADGRAGPADLAGARKLWRQTCPDEDISCSRLAESLYDEDPTRALDIAREGCGAGGSASCYWAGLWSDWKHDRGLALRYLRTGCAWGDESSCASLGTVVVKRSIFDPEAEVVWTESCGRQYDKSCQLLAEHLAKRSADRAAAMARSERECGEGKKGSCNWLCLDRMGQPQAPCPAACALGAKELCPTPTADEAAPPQ